MERILWQLLPHLVITTLGTAMISSHTVRNLALYKSKIGILLQCSQNVDAWQWSEEEAMSWWGPWWGPFTSTFCEHCCALETQ